MVQEGVEIEAKEVSRCKMAASREREGSTIKSLAFSLRAACQGLQRRCCVGLSAASSTLPARLYALRSLSFHVNSEPSRLCHPKTPISLKAFASMKPRRSRPSSFFDTSTIKIFIAQLRLSLLLDILYLVPPRLFAPLLLDLILLLLLRSLHSFLTLSGVLDFVLHSLSWISLSRLAPTQPTLLKSFKH